MLTLRRIVPEERILGELFGLQYQEYRRRVSALGPPWCCLGYDRGARRSAPPYERLD